jgi:chorismate mutase-like protein
MTFRRSSLIAGALCALAILIIPAAAQAASPHQSAKDALRLSAERLSFMRGVMATKWASRSPVEAPQQEATVIAAARDLATKQGLNADTVTKVFEQEIGLAKTVEIGWGSEWLLHGFPADEPVPDLTQLRTQLAAFSPKIVQALSGLGNFRCGDHARRTLLRDGKRLVRTRYVTKRDRERLVDAILRVHETAAPRCGASPSA